MSSGREGVSVAVNGNNQFKIKQGSLEQNLVLVPFAQERSELHWDNRNITQEVLLCTKNLLPLLTKFQILGTHNQELMSTVKERQTILH